MTDDPVSLYLPPEPGAFTSPVNISAAIAQADGLPIDWWLRGPRAGAIGFALRKGGSPNLLNVALLPTSTPGNNNAAVLNTRADASFNWSDGPAGFVTGAGDSHLVQYPADMSGGGFRITVPCPKHPDYYYMRAWLWDFPSRRIQYFASLNDASTTTKNEIIDNATGANPGLGNQPLIYIDTKFASVESGRTFTFDVSALYEYYPGIYAVALYKAKRKPAHRGPLRQMLMQGVLSPLGGRRG